jgi:hypothetical protein
MAADITAVVLTAICAALAAGCVILVVRLWRAGSGRQP